MNYVFLGNLEKDMEKVEKERDFPSSGSLSKCPPQPELARTKVRSENIRWAQRG